MAAGIARALAPMSSALQTGYFTHQVLDQLGVPRAASALHRIRDALRDALGDERGRALADAVAEELARVRRRAREHVSATLARRVSEPEAGARRRAEGVPFTSLTSAEIEEVRRAVRALAERLRGAERVRRRHAARGRIDPHRTLRQSLRTGGVPFSPARRRRRRDKPRLLVLCDVSDSVRAASLFMLEFAHAAQELFSGTRSFVFVSELVETTRLFDEQPVAAALGRIYRGGVVDTGHNSTTAASFRAFEARVGGAIDRRTTIVILGDGRSNYFADEAEVVARLRDRARAVLWLCPEGKGTWGRATAPCSATRPRRRKCSWLGRRRSSRWPRARSSPGAERVTEIRSPSQPRGVRPTRALCCSGASSRRTLAARGEVIGIQAALVVRLMSPSN